MGNRIHSSIGVSLEIHYEEKNIFQKLTHLRNTNDLAKHNEKNLGIYYDALIIGKHFYTNLIAVLLTKQ